MKHRMEGGWASPDPDDGTAPGVAPEVFRDALARWASGVTVVAVRDGASVHATTVSSFFAVSARPPLVAVSLGPNARVLPFLEEGARFGVSVLAQGQRRLATTFADSFPVGPPPFPAEGDPLLPEAHAALACTVRHVFEVEGGARLVAGRVEEARVGAPEDGGPLIHYTRGWQTLAG